MNRRPDPSWFMYPGTILEIASPARTVRIDLRTPADTNLLPFDGSPFGIVTAHNPHGRISTPGENAKRHAMLTARLAGSGWRHVPATGLSADGGHAEAGFAVEAAREDLLALAEAMEQTAMFWYDGERFWLWPVRGAPVALPAVVDRGEPA